MTTADLSFLADCLRFIVLPAVIFEVLREERRIHIDRVLSQRAWSMLIWSGAALIGIIGLAFLSLLISQYVWTSAWVVSAFLLVALLVGDATDWRGIFEKGLAPILVAIGTGWALFEITPESAALSNWSLFAWAEAHAKTFVAYNSGTPIYQPEMVSEALWRRDEAEDIAKEQLWSHGYFERLFMWDSYKRNYIDVALIIAKALSILIFILLNLGVVIFAIAICVIPLALVVNGIYWLSNAIKSLFRIETEARYPLGAAAILAVAEVLSFAISAKLYFFGA